MDSNLNNKMYLCVGCNALIEARYCLDTSKIREFDSSNNYIKDNFVIIGKMICDDCYYDNNSSIEELFEKL